VRWGINAAYLADTIPDLSPSLVDQGVRPPYLLYVGGEIPRKRLDWALRVWSAVADERDLRLVVVGLHAPTNPEWMSQVPLRLRNRLVALSFVEEADVPGLYAAAEAVLYPTLYEGFGFPALESQAVGTPVLMSAVGSLRELAGPGAIILPPENLECWIDATRNAAAHKHSASLAAREWARQFSWARTWRQLEDIYTSRS
jgi:alpha-1,3-rhamnosyl/mannosyltransferase